MPHFLLHLGSCEAEATIARARTAAPPAEDDAVVWVTRAIGRTRAIAAAGIGSGGGWDWTAIDPPLAWPGLPESVREAVRGRRIRQGTVLELPPGAGRELLARVPSLERDWELAELRAEFRLELVRRAEALEDALTSLRGGGADAGPVRAIAHQIKGAAGSYGFPGISRLAGGVMTAELDELAERGTNLVRAIRRAAENAGHAGDPVSAPAAESAPPPAPQDVPAAPRAVRPTPSAGPILIVEDDRFVAAMVAHRLDRSGYPVQVASDGELALVACRADPPRLVILDLSLPRLGGFELLEMLRLDGLHRDTPVLVLTASGSEKDLIRAFDLGADDYIVKPFSPAALMARVQRHLTRGHGRHP
ncbi:MAG: response regulator [Gemmatimonadales bacterium]